jgi:bifunctional enzyme CysN/CysC
MTVLSIAKPLRATALASTPSPVRTASRLEVHDAGIAAARAEHAGASSLRILTCGSVDDGKSTLIGRLLWDATDLYDDTRAALLGKNGDGTPDFSRLLDGLVAEREQGITIDVAWRYFDTATRRIVVIDSPGHEQYTRNMASGASHADLAILLVDARHGIKKQTRRHAAILDLMGVKRVVLAVNKMDLVGYDEARFRAVEAEFKTLAWHFGFWQHVAIPLAAVNGENVAARAASMPWYRGPTLLEHLDATPGRVGDPEQPFRFPVQRVVRHGDFRGLAGTISSGSVSVGDEIVDALSHRRARVARIATFDGDLAHAETGRAVVIGIDSDLDIARGDVIADAAHAPVAASSLEARIVWLGEQPYDARAGYLLRTATDLVAVDALQVKGLLNLATLAVHAADRVQANDIAIVRLDLGRPVALDPFASQSETGAFLLVDAVSGATVAGGTVSSARARDDAGAHARPAQRRGADSAGDGANAVFVLDEAVLRAGLCRDLGTSDTDIAELRRRADEVQRILQMARVSVERAGV